MQKHEEKPLKRKRSSLMTRKRSSNTSVSLLIDDSGSSGEEADNES